MSEQNPEGSRRALLPFYLVADISYSMSGEPIDALNDALPEVHDAIATDLVVADKTRFSIISFSGAARVELPMSDLSDVDSMPVFQPEGGTSYAAAFTTLKQQIEQDVSQLKADGFRVFRPAVFFFSDGGPTDSPDEWKSAVAAVHDLNWSLHPNIISFGLGDADGKVIGAIGTVKAYLAHDPGESATAIREFARKLTQSIVQSGRQQDPTLIPPSAVEGAEEIPVGISLDEV